MTVSKATQILKQIHNPTSTHGNVKLQQNNTTTKKYLEQDTEFNVNCYTASKDVCHIKRYLI